MAFFFFFFSDIQIVHSVYMFCWVILTCHFLILGAPAAAAKEASHFWASCLFFWGLLLLLSHTQTQYNKITWRFKKNCEYRNITWETGDLRGWRGWQVHRLSPSPAQHHSENGNMKTWCVLTTASVHGEVNPLTKTNLFLSPSLSFNNIWGLFICQTLKCKHIKSLWCDDE